MNMVGHEGVAIELDFWPIELSFCQDASAKLSNTVFRYKEEVSSKCLADHMVGD